MLKISTSLLMSVFVLTQSLSIHFSDILKLESLFEHMEFHETAYGDDIFSFISKHYGNKMKEHEGENDDDSEHQKLPFNHKVSCDTGHLFVLELDQPGIILNDSTIAKERDFFYYNFYSYLENTDIFQPPRIA
jgi:hypothetical protein